MDTRASRGNEGKVILSIEVREGKKEKGKFTERQATVFSDLRNGVISSL